MQEPKCFQNFAELIEFPDERGKKFIESWFPDAEPDTFIAEPNASTAENLSQDFDLSLFTSTPYHRNRGPFLNITDDPSLLDAWVFLSSAATSIDQIRRCLFTFFCPTYNAFLKNQDYFNIKAEHCLKF